MQKLEAAGTVSRINDDTLIYSNIPLTPTMLLQYRGYDLLLYSTQEAFTKLLSGEELKELLPAETSTYPAPAITALAPVGMAIFQQADCLEILKIEIYE